MKLDIQKLKQAAQNATQGQWIVEDQDCPWNVVDADGTQVAMAQQRTAIRDNRKQTDRTANAAFIAQANPENVLELIRQRDELLEQLESVVAWLEQGDVDSTFIDPMRAAIAKAKGGAA